MKICPLLLACLLVALLLAQASSAVPQISNLSGTMISGQTIAISGSGFGVKSPAEPISWDDFEAQTVGNTVANSVPVVGPNWTLLQGAPGTDPIIFDNARSVSGTRSVKVSWLNETINAFGWRDQGPYTQLYISYWRYQTGTYTQGVNNHKQFYVFGNYGVHELPQFLNFIPAADIRWGFSNNQACNGGTYATENNLNDITYNASKDRWDRWEFLIKLNTVNTADGTVKEWVNGALKKQRTDYKHRCDEVTGEWEDFRLGNMFQGPGSGPPDALKEAWFDDVYIDTTQARVEICDASNWSAKDSSGAICAIQVPSIWSEDSIIVTINHGQFTPGQTAYLYVIDANGNVNANGYPVTIGTPSISSVSGTFNQGNAITISGSNFGIKSNPTQTVSAAPLVWDITSEQYLGGVNINAYSGLVDGSPINSNLWQHVSAADATLRYSTSRPHRNPQVLAQYSVYNSPSNYTKLCLGTPVYPGGLAESTIPQKSYYLSFYRKVKNPACTSNSCPNGGGDGATKLLRIDSPQLDLTGIDTLTHSGLFQTNSVTERGAWVYAGTETDWVRWEVYVDVSKQWYDVWKNSHYHLGNWSGAGGSIEFRPASDWRFRSPALSGYQFDAPTLPANHSIIPALFGYDDGHQMSLGQEIDVSEIYYDNTLARVEISDQPAWNDSPASTAHREVQGRLLTWSDNSITFNFYQGAFSSGQTAYLYVIDANGNVNANGYPVTIGGSAPACIHNSDLPPCDGCVNSTELTSFIDRWKVSNTDVTLRELIESIGLWKRGC